MQKNIIIIIVLIGILFSSCKSDDVNPNNTLIGNWKLVAILVDPGDGSGTFMPIESDKTITFKKNNIITSNGNLCDLSIDADNSTIGTYSFSEMTFNSADCLDPNYNYSFEQNGDSLIVYYPCIEACEAKYAKQ